MRRETLKALEQRRDDVITERKQSKMQTLGASNPYNNNKDKHRSATKLTGDTVDKIFANGGGVDNSGFDASGPHSSNTDDEASSTTRNSSSTNMLRSSITFKDRSERIDRSSSDRHSTSATSKM
jgi:chitin synthase